jgi:Mg-chelatase subunit ChlD
MQTVDFTSDKGSFKAVVTNLKRKPWSTNTAAALERATEIVKDRTFLNQNVVAVIITDGQPNVFCGRINPVKCTRQRFNVLKQFAGKVVFVRLETRVRVDLFQNKETLLINAKWNNLLGMSIPQSIF